MKMRWILAPLVLAGSALVAAQSGSGYMGGHMAGYGMHERGMTEFYEALDLTGEQQEKAAAYIKERRAGKFSASMEFTEPQREQMQQLWAAHQQEREALYSKYGLTEENRAAMRQEMQAMREAHHAAMNNMLTDEQRDAMPGRGAYGGHHGYRNGSSFGGGAGCANQ